jgi:rod shape determining protein RodA
VTPRGTAQFLVVALRSRGLPVTLAPRQGGVGEEARRPPAESEAAEEQLRGRQRGKTLVQHALDRRRVLDHRASSSRYLLQHVDVLLVFSTVAMATLGVVMVYYATRAKLVSQGVNPHYYLDRQAVFVALGLAVMVLVASIDYHRFEEWTPYVYGVVVIGLLAVLSPAGKTSLGAARWFSIGSFQLQPSSFASLAIILVAAVYSARHLGDLGPRRIAVLLGVGAIPILLVMKQPDLATGIIMSVCLFTILVVAGARVRYLLALALLAAGALALVVHFGVLKDYQVQRLTSFIDQGQGHSGQPAVYNLQQSKIAIANGGLTGEGLGRGTQTNLAYVPEQQTDFIFTAVGEELGFAGTGTVLAIFGLMVWRLLRAAQLARDQLGRLLCAGVFVLIAFSVFENAGMTMGIMPIAGIPLPFMSYGGSSTVIFFAAIGVALNVGMRRYR